MGSVGEAGATTPSSGRIQRPAFGAYVAHPKPERAEPETEQCEADRFARRIQWPALMVLVLLETAWLAGVGYLLHRLLG